MRLANIHKGFIFLSVLTVMVQYYEYHLYGFMAAKIGEVFFPSENQTVQILKTYLVMTIAFMAKPLGAIYYGSKGDKFGRTNSFRMSIMLCAMASLVIFILPGFDKSGIYAIIILLFCRMVICASASAGSDGVRIFVFENLPPDRRCIGSAITTIFTQIGSLLAALSAWYFMQEKQADIFWRFPFLIGAFMGLSLVFVSILFKLHDPVSNEKKVDIDSFSYKSLITNNKALLFLLIIIIGCVGSVNQFLFIFFSTYNFEILKFISRSEMQFYLIMAICLYMISALVAGYLADNSDKVKMILNACLALCFVMLVQAYFLTKGQLSISMFFLAAIFMPFIHMPISVILKASAPKAVRYRVFSLAHAVGSVLISAPTSFIATLLYSFTGIVWLPMLYSILSIAILAFCLTRVTKLDYSPAINKSILGAT